MNLSCGGVWLRALLLLALWVGAQAALPLWRAELDGKAVWLLGSVHAAKGDVYPLAAPIEAAFQAAESLIVEADISDQTASAAMVAQTMLAAGETQEALLTPELARHLQQRAAAGGIKPEQAARMKPWLLAMTLTLSGIGKSGYSAQHGVDLHFLLRAKRDGKQRLELESVAGQIELLNNLPREQLIAFVEDALLRQSRRTVEREVEQISAAWAKGDTAAIARSLARNQPAGAAGAALMRRLLTDRNPAMVERIAPLAQAEHPPFVVIGLGHLVGPGSVLELLQQRGFRVVQQTKP